MTGIYKMDKEDLMKYAELYVELFNAEPWNDRWTVATAYKRLENIYNTPHFVGMKYLESGEIKGAIFGNCQQWYLGMHYNLMEMFVVADSQGKGIGASLMMTLETELKLLGVNTIILFTSKDETDVFYKKQGFKELGFMCMMEKGI
ncbi:GNAT family N-acetyltransferase [Alkaliphilus hydrothermalis]|uniref:GNAT superfamily N-acetyltransferase n=1 Tax=Alkaliphilus hydrothermalis TaxID=1482730 RepID=A0ABS2NN23_9FIRM|nr:GNAT family N-acetyltransferase [Alkaliphilus hydrothermalis]MBM7613974.1 GNAT superfamily N-acetyltransferase [Alkaliphilus hydrothermalis]